MHSYRPLNRVMPSPQSNHSEVKQEESEVDSWEVPPSRKQIIKKTKKVLAEVVIGYENFNHYLVYQKLNQNNIGLPSNGDELYNVKFSFAVDFIRHLEKWVEQCAYFKIPSIDKQMMRPLMKYIFQCRNILDSTSAQTIVGVMRDMYSEKTEVHVTDLINLHKLLSQLAIEKRNEWITKKKGMQKFFRPKLVTDKLNQHPGESNIEVINTIWTNNHADLLLQAFRTTSKHSHIQKMFEKQFPEHKHLWNVKALLLLWYRRARSALKALREIVMKHRSYEYPSLPELNHQFSVYLTRKNQFRRLQLNLVSIAEEEASAQLIQETVEMIIAGREKYENMRAKRSHKIMNRMSVHQ